MASADGGQQEPGGSQLAVPDGPQVPGGGQQMPQDAFDLFPDDGGEQEPDGSQLAVPDGRPRNEESIRKQLRLPVREDTDRFRDHLH